MIPEEVYECLAYEWLAPPSRRTRCSVLCLSPCFKPLLRWWAPHPPPLVSWELEGGSCLNTAPTPVPHIGHISWGIRSTETKRWHIEVPCVTLPYACTMGTKYYCAALVLHGLNAAFKERRAKQTFPSPCQYNAPMKCWLQEKWLCPASLAEIGVSPLCMADTGTHIL